MKTITSANITINGSEAKAKVMEGKLLIETKKGDFQISFAAKNQINFVVGDKEVKAPVDGGEVEAVVALFNCLKKEGRELVVFESYEEFLGIRSENNFGAVFYINSENACYKYGAK